MDSIKEISEDLQIQFLAQETGTFITDFDKFTQKLDDQQEKVDKVNELFDLLSGIKKKQLQILKIQLLSQIGQKQKKMSKNWLLFYFK